MPYNPDAMTIIVSGDLPPEMAEKLQSQLTADVLTAQEFAQRESVLEKQQEVEQDTEKNRVDAGLEKPNEGDDFQAPEKTVVDDIEVTDTSAETTEENEEVPSDDNVEKDENSDEEATDVEQEDLDEVTEEDASVKDELDEPNAALEHAQSIGTKEVGLYLRLGVARYKRRVRRLSLATETLQMEAAQREKLIRRLLYVKPQDAGFTSKLQTFINTIDNPEDWVALIDMENAGSGAELTSKQITEALNKAGIEMYDNVETLANACNQLQKAITEPAGSTNDSSEF